MTAAKHPPDRNGSKAFASEENSTTKRNPDDADEIKRTKWSTCQACYLLSLSLSLSLPSVPCSGEPSPISGHPWPLNSCHISLVASMAVENILGVSSSWVLSAQSKDGTLMEMDVGRSDVLDVVQDMWINHGSQIREMRPCQLPFVRPWGRSEMGTIRSFPNYTGSSESSMLFGHANPTKHASNTSAPIFLIPWSGDSFMLQNSFLLQFSLDGLACLFCSAEMQNHSSWTYSWRKIVRRVAMVVEIWNTKVIVFVRTGAAAREEGGWEWDWEEGSKERGG